MKKDIYKILNIASNSPSSHNTQPWLIRIGDSNIVLGYDPMRQLLIGDPEKRELFISLGCFIESVVLAAQDLGYESNVKFVSSDNFKTAEINFIKKSLKTANWRSLILSRRSDRRLYDKTKLSESDISKIKKIDFGDVTINLFTSYEDINFLAKTTYDSTKEIMLAPAFRGELSSWVRNNWTKKKDGMPAYTQGMPGIVSLLAKTIIKNNPKVAISQAKKDSKRITNSAAVGIITVPKNFPEYWIKAGRLYQHVCLSVLMNDIKTSAISAPLILPSTNQLIIKKLNIEGKPVVLMRFGYKKGNVKASPRLNVEQLTF